MRHIESNSCTEISVKEFEEQRAKKQVLRAQFQNALSSDPYVLTREQFISEAGSVAGGVALDDSAPGFPDDILDDAQIGSHIGSHVNKMGTMDRPSHPGNITNSEKWPKLGATKSDNSQIKQDAEEINLMDVLTLGNGDEKNEEADKVPPMSKQFFPQQPSIASHMEPDKVSLAASYSWKDPEGINKSGSVGASNCSDTSQYDARKFFDPFQSRYVCPSKSCNRQFATEKEFNAHLLTDAHVGGPAR